MEKQKEQLEHLAEIRALMEKSSRFISLSGLSGVMAGIFALVGAGIAYFYFHQQYYYPNYEVYLLDYHGNITMDAVLFLFLDALGVLVAAIGFGAFFTIRKAKREGVNVWSKSAKRLLINLMIPLATGGLFGLLLLAHNEVYLIPSITLIFYGLALVNASKYTLENVRYLGFAQILLGLASAFYIGYGLVFWALGFGVLHIIYGCAMYFKYDR